MCAGDGDARNGDRDASWIIDLDDLLSRTGEDISKLNCRSIFEVIADGTVDGALALLVLDFSGRFFFVLRDFLERNFRPYLGVTGFGSSL